jgi:transcriptional regulator with XRE-family HTH domain
MRGAELKRIRESLGLSMRELADQLGVHHITVWRWEHDKFRMGRHTDKFIRDFEVLQKSSQEYTNPP